MQFRILVGDITQWPADAIVNSANSTLLGSGGVDRAIHQAGGISLTTACRALKGCHIGDAKVTYGYHLPVKFVIHTVPPLWSGGKKNEDAAISSCYKKCFILAKEKQINHLAFTPLATENNRIPVAADATVSIPIIMENGSDLERVDIVCKDKEMQNVYTRAVVVFWLEHLVSASSSELENVAKEAIPSLVLLHLFEDEPDPVFLAKGVRHMRELLGPFLDGSTTCNLIDIDRISEKIMTHTFI